MSNLKSYLEQVKEREAKATPAPWDNRCLNSLDNMGKPRYIWTEYGFICELKSPLDSSVVDAEFISHARTDVPKLLRLVQLMSGALEYITSKEQMIGKPKWDAKYVDVAKTALTECERILSE